MRPSVGIRELRQHLSRYTARTALGESFDVTDRGQPVGRLVPPASDAPWLDELVVAGAVRPARAHSQRFPPPVEVGAGSISGALAAERAERLP